MHKAFIHPHAFDTLRTRSRGYLPHWELDGSTYSLTFRLADSLPRHVVSALLDERLALVRSITGGPRPPTLIERMEIDRLFGVRLDLQLDAAYGRCELRRPELANIVSSALTFFDGDRYELAAWCVMPNHVHVVMTPADGWRLDTILQSWKSYTSKQVNKALGRQGRFWQREYFDRVVRDRDDFVQSVGYVVNNPVKAGLGDWPFVWARSDLKL
ncbi:MAG: transposase [Thermoanaerobaculia bacterium]|nr:transposase [Thermoanaerobaculia bacterium]